MSDIYSRKDFTGRNLTSRQDMSEITITGSCFSQDRPDTKVFPDNLFGTTFVNCNLDNCIIPPDNTLINCSTRRYMAIETPQEDGDGIEMVDWLVDENNNPIQRL